MRPIIMSASKSRRTTEQLWTVDVTRLRGKWKEGHVNSYCYSSFLACSFLAFEQGSYGSMIARPLLFLEFTGVSILNRLGFI
jgi:hypothetical protein